jgi:hypothetical protein
MAERTICGVDAELVERFLMLIRDHYGSAAKAMFVLERTSGAVSYAGLKNMNDVLSHLATFLDSSTPPDKLSGQLSSAEEHLRRAIIEPYEIALADAIVAFDKLHKRYKRDVLARKQLLAGTVPDAERVNSTLAEISKLAAAGREAKANNLWDAKWEEGVLQFATALEKLKGLTSELEAGLVQASRLKYERQQKQQLILTVWSVIATILCGLLSFFLMNPTLVGTIRKLIGIR